MDVEQFGALFESFERSAFRVEARDHYDGDAEREEFAAFVEGKGLRARTEGHFLGVHQPSDSRLYLEAKQRALSLAIDFEHFAAGN